MKQFFKSFQHLKLIVSYGEITLIVRFQDLTNVGLLWRYFVRVAFSRISG